MMVGACRLDLRLPENGSLKGKRQTVKSIVARTHAKFGVAVAEVENNEAWQIASFGIACVSTSRAHADEVVRNVVRYIEASRPDLELISCDVEILQGL
jgi:uncharacterized protein YlxP (DUF503 family)